VLLEPEAGRLLRCRRHVEYGVDQAAGRAHDRHRAVAQRHHLVQTARLVARRHEQHVCASVDLVGDRFLELRPEDEASGEARDHLLHGGDRRLQRRVELELGDQVGLAAALATQITAS